MATTPPSSPTGLWSWLPRWASGRDSAAPAGAPLKQQRASNRELLFGVVRENMIRAGVLSSTYKFKVLTLDPAGEQFIVMMDWQPGAARTDEAHHLALEKGLQQLARERLGFRVKAVYWRHASAAALKAPAQAPLAAASAASVAPSSAPSAPAAPLDPDAVSEDELMAFKAALRSPAGARPAPQPDPRRGDAPDFQPTVITEDAPGTDFGSLSETQYGPPR